VIGGAIAVIVAVSSGGSSKAPGFNAKLQAVPTNHVTGTGTATVQFNGDSATVTVDTHGLLPAVHLMHVHGGTGTCPSASVAKVVNGKRFISAATGDASYGPVVTSLTQFGDTSADSHLAAARFASGANIRYRRTIVLTGGAAHQIRSDLGAIVVHGIDYDGNGTYDNSLGLDAEAGAPALCGVLLPTKSGATAHSSGTVYTASLALYSGTAARSLRCHVSATASRRPSTAGSDAGAPA
jgi:hypothetical protein